VDIILSEGYKGENKPKVEIFREKIHNRPLCLEDGNLIALMTDANIDLGVPQFSIGDVNGLADFLIRYFKLNQK
jgi:molybdopterin-guanine dinucleotide biosynthesis protein B